MPHIVPEKVTLQAEKGKNMHDDAGAVGPATIASAHQMAKATLMLTRLNDIQISKNKEQTFENQSTPVKNVK